MATPRTGQSSSGQGAEAGGSSRPVSLQGDSPEVVAFALLRYLAQLEQGQAQGKTFDRKWMLDAYAECLEAVKGERARAASPVPEAGAAAAEPSPETASEPARAASAKARGGRR